jgi:glycosyltransferase involved in cell wall biosynthesis
MSKPADDRSKEPLAVVLPVHNAADRLEAVAGGWLDFLGKVGRECELVVVDDGSTDPTPDILASLAKKSSRVRTIRHDARRGFGACLRTALAATDQPLFFYTAADYPYTPADLTTFLNRINDTDEVTGRKLDVVSGCRTGVPVPPGWKLVGRLYRLFCRIALGFPRDPLPGWLGFRDHWRAWLVWLVFGVPVNDVNSAFKLFRRSVFDRFPIQSDGDFVHTEVIAKATFTTCLMDELLLTPKPDHTPPTWWEDFWLVLTDARFTPPPGVLPPPAEASPPREPAVAEPVPSPTPQT